MYSGSRNPESTIHLVTPHYYIQLGLGACPSGTIFCFGLLEEGISCKRKEECSSVMQEWNLCSSFEVNLAMREERLSDAVGNVYKVKNTFDSMGAKELYEVFVAFQKTLAVEKGEEKEIPALKKKFTLLLRRLLEEIGRLH